MLTDTSDDSEEDSSLSDLLEESESEEDQSRDSDIEATQLKQLVGEEDDFDCS